MYLNIGNDGFRAARNGEYVDKSELISVINSTLCSERQFTCVSRARRFGKSMAAKMLNAYYDKSCDSRSLFSGLKIASDPSFEQHLNKYPVIYVDMTEFVTRYRDNNRIVDYIQLKLVKDLQLSYPSVDYSFGDDLLSVLYAIVKQAEPQKFIMIIDEWDAILREFPVESNIAAKYVDFLRLLFKSVNSMTVFSAVYMTGILPIKKYNTQSALNNFEEYTMVAPGIMAPYFGFTEEEVSALCLRYNADMEQLKLWYDGYQLGEQQSIYNPLSVIRAITRNYYESYWSNTGTFETITHYIKLNYDGLKDDVINLLAGNSCQVNTKNFQNDLNVINSKNDVLTVLIHLGYLAYDRLNSKCYIPNKEVNMAFANAIEDSGWHIVAQAITQSDKLLKSVLSGNEQQVAQSIDLIHSDNTSILQYNDENSLACVLTLAFYAAKNTYTMIRELPAGKGYADIVLLPNRDITTPAIVLELKYNQSAQTAISQIKEKRYTDSLLNYSGEILLVGINYDKQTKQHTCIIEKTSK